MTYSAIKRRNSSRSRYTAIFLILLFVFEIGKPALYAGGPNQPETATFTPASADNLVDLFSGDFSYNIPLFEVDGYPINLAYNAGIRPEQEASWVGLGWNLNPGAITRDVRGIPDDFKGDSIRYEKNIKDNVTVGLSAGAGGEIVGLPLGSVNVSAGLSYNNYRGFDLTTNAGISLGATIAGKGGLTSALSVNNSSMNGISVSPSLSLSYKTAASEAGDASVKGSLTASSSYNSRSGVQQVSYGVGVSVDFQTTQQKQVGDVTTNETTKHKRSSSSFASVGLGYSLPRVNSDFENFSVSGRFTLGGEVFLSNAHAFVNGFYSSQKLRNKTQNKKAYGCLNSSFATDASTDVMDFSRENEVGFSFELPALPLAQMTPDILTVSGQGVSGSYKPYSNAFGVVIDPSGKSTSSSTSLGVEVAAGNIFEGGANVERNRVDGHTGSWVNSNAGMTGLGFKKPKANSNYENVYYQEANEKGQFVNNAFYNTTGKDEAVRFKLEKQASYEHATSTVLEGGNGQNYTASNNFSDVRSKRNKPVGLLTAGEVIGGGGVTATSESESWSVHSVNNPHHIGEISVLGEDGKRFIYGLPVYNTKKEEVTFAVGTKNTGQPYSGTAYCDKGQISYTPGTDDTAGNDWGLDNYFNGVYTPAYAHSYLPTCILGTNYIDADDEQGPSDGDFGEWVKFEYHKMDKPYKWRMPFGSNNQSDPSVASFNPGIETDKTDDKASYVYGEKELVYLETILTRNYVLKFSISDREDGYGVKGSQGGIDNQGSSAIMQKLDSIQMFTKHELSNPNPVPVKTVHFVYDDGNGGYDLCENTPTNINAGRGKLTLHEVYFTYRSSSRAKYNPYKFQYSDVNPDYSEESADRWGNFKTQVASPDCNIATSELSTANYPYADQDDTTADLNSSAWNIVAIKLPTGGKIEVDYEADRYGFVQHKRAQVMKKTASVKFGGGPEFNGPEAPLAILYDGAQMKLGIKLDPGATIFSYATVNDLIYFRSLVKLGTANETERSDFISGYGRVVSLTQEGNTGYIEFADVDIHGIDNQNPILVAALQYARLHLSHMVYGTELINTDAGLGLQLLESIITSFSNLGNMFTSPNQQILDNGRANVFWLDKTWLKLNNPRDYKIGGGHRVKEIRMYDNWDDMTGEAGVASKTVYSYDLESGETSGVASNEPMAGGEESALIKPRFLDEKNLLAPDNRYYVEEPFAKSFFPNPSVGYSRVKVEKFELSGVDYAQINSTGTGYSVHEFYTSKDYPTIYKSTGLSQLHDKTPDVSFAKLFGHKVKDFIAFSQGYMVETNDMHGKQKRVSIFSEDAESPIQYTVYKYQDELFGWQGSPNTRRLVNDKNTLISPSGSKLYNRPIGIFYEILADSKEEGSDAEIFTVSANVDASMAFIIPLVIPTIIPSKSTELTSFKYASVTKTIQKFGILEKVVSFDQGSLSEESYLAYDSETGKVIVTKTQNNFNDAYYTMDFPAHWSYDEMGPAHVNLGFFTNGAYVYGNGKLGGLNTSQLSDGDEIILKQGNNYINAWVMKNQNGIKVFDSEGSFPTGSYQSLKIKRSGKRNLLGENMMKLITLENPLNGLSGDSYTRVVSASGVEYGNVWRTICNCFGPESSTVGLETTNPFKMGARGLYRPLRSYTYLTKRTQTDVNDNTNVRVDGIFSSFNPLYHRDGGNWNLHPQNWTFDTEVTEYSPEGYELDTRDALSRHSSALYGYNRSLQVAMAQNAQQKEIGYDSFEDSKDAFCGTDHMRFGSEAGIDSTKAHTGAKSLLVASSNPVSISKYLQECEPIYSYLCELVVDQDSTSNELIITIGCYTDPLSIEYEILQGNPNIEINGNVITISNSGNSFELGQISISILDGADCIYESNVTYQFIGL